MMIRRRRRMGRRMMRRKRMKMRRRRRIKRRWGWVCKKNNKWANSDWWQTISMLTIRESVDSKYGRDTQRLQYLSKNTRIRLQMCYKLLINIQPSSFGWLLKFTKSIVKTYYAAAKLPLILITIIIIIIIINNNNNRHNLNYSSNHRGLNNSSQPLNLKKHCKALCRINLHFYINSLIQFFS